MTLKLGNTKSTENTAWELKAGPGISWMGFDTSLLETFWRKPFGIDNTASSFISKTQFKQLDPKEERENQLFNYSNNIHSKQFNYEN